MEEEYCAFFGLILDFFFLFLFFWCGKKRGVEGGIWLLVLVKFERVVVVCFQGDSFKPTPTSFNSFVIWINREFRYPYSTIIYCLLLQES